MSRTTDPPVSQAQRRAMGATMGGNSNLGIPKSVGREFMESDPGGKLPETAKDVDSPLPQTKTEAVVPGTTTADCGAAMSVQDIKRFGKKHSMNQRR